MTDGASGTLVVGADPQAAALALLLAANGPVRLHVPDPDDAARLRDGLWRLPATAAGGHSLWLESGPLGKTDVDLVLVSIDALVPVAVEGGLSDDAILVVLAADLGLLAQRMRRPERLFGLQPADAVGGGALVELIAPPTARRDLLARLTERLRAAGLVVVPAQDRGAGTLAQRLSLRMGDAVEVVLMSGLTPWDLDAAVCAHGCARGPLETQDLTGLDRAFALRRHRATRLRAAGKPVPATPAQDRMLAEGRLGKTAGVGWYRYPGGGGAVIDPLIEDLIAEEAHFARHPRPGVAPEAAAEMMIAALIDEGARALADGTAADARTLDLTARHLLAFPRPEAGLLALGAASGAERIAVQLERLAALGQGLMPPLDPADAEIAELLSARVVRPG